MIKDNSRNKKKPKAKKVASYDNKIILITVIAVVAVTAAILAAVLINNFVNSYIGKVGGKRVRDYEYKYFLSSVMEEMESEAEEADEDFDSSAYWTDEKITEAEEKAVEEVTKWEAEYIIANANGGKLTKTEKENISSNLQYYIYYYYQQMSSYYTVDQICQMITGVTYDELDDYTEYLYKQETINKYREALEEDYNVEDLYYTDDEDNKTTGEEAVKALYNSDRDCYRRINLNSLVFAKPEKPTEPTAVEEPEKPENYDELAETDEARQTYDTNLEAYNTYLTELETYKTELEEYETECAELVTKVQAIFEALSTDGKYTGSGISEVDTEEEDDDGNTITAIPEYTDATLEDIQDKEGESVGGEQTYTGEVDDSSAFLEKLAQSMEWTDDTRTAVKSLLAEAATEEAAEEDASNEEASEEETSEEETETVYDNDYNFISKTEDGKFSETELKLFEDDSYYYIVKCTGILDLDTSTESEKDEDGNVTDECVRDTVIDDLKVIKSGDDLEKMVEDAGDKYALKGKKSKVIANITADVFAE